MSAKLRVTLWSTLQVLILSAMTLVFVLVINTEAVTGEASGRLVKAVQRNVNHLEFDRGHFEWDDIDFYRRGVFTSVYDSDGNLILGAAPVGFELKPAFEHSALRSFSSGGKDYYVYDVYVDMTVTGVWLRGVVPTNDSSNLMHIILILTYTLLPLLIVTSVVGGWFIARSAFRPMEQIMDAAESITDGDDLSRRIALKRGPSEMKRLSRSFDRMFSRLEASFNTQKQFSSDASHELRTPITVILAECDRAKRKDNTREEFLSSLAVIEEQGQMMNELVQSLLCLTRLEHGTERYPRARGDLSLMLAALCDEFVPEDERGITLSLDIQDGIETEFNPMLISRLVQNLLSNAYKYGRENGSILVSLNREESKAVLRVKDDGIGIAPEDIDKIWQRFWQAAPSRCQNGSTGLGLAMVKDIAQFHGGVVECESIPGVGTVFTVSLPIA